MAGNKESVAKTLTVAFLVCLVCAVVVSTAAVTLRPVQQKNQTLDRRVNILQAAGLYQPGMDVQAAFETIERRFVDLETGEYVDKPDSYDQLKAAKDPEQSEALSGDEDIASIKRQADVAEVFLARDDSGDLSRIILPVRGYGLWSTLYGFMALEPDAKTIAGLGFYQHGETPGLGGEVDNPKWKALWEGKKIYDEDGDVAIQVIKGTVDSKTPNAENKVDGLAGATLTSKGVSHLVRFWVGEKGFGPYLERMQQNGAGDAGSDAGETGGEA
ncbi:MAG: Na(+)-translocating NADH-quinone reductase subunit C [Alcanivorax sp.]|nr:Na(+)-translocating NADH-quinone reductase subunit C [Alcanivorax sp.]MBM1144437.1 Na(+)-translocating NADH-quinone reductase subunit C [Alcanivorax sp. ZXX171]MCQ6263541.1 Na(+)-translocating NADH-quinone reductase subunit C [Alcanivorax sp. MM125-6]UWN48445.1 Na(+)-translocating NADH-quinone reductase subunit C [Alcanivorax sp. ALC70]MAY11433.1 Na(+)-translocating NADH-quinone reductase subunit C [Alcanivorax sp.]|tara:strand:- start:31998 stop:32813 length:816 start_codon:yes stop_codon:yes gene_type:complete